ncbi:MAG: OB-fold nucleic acid binding domain-containing protein, partial [Desulfurobacteriaceae bacterium]
EVRLAGAIVGAKTRRTQRGELWANVELLDLDGTVQILVFPNVYKDAMELVTEGNLVVVEGVVREDEDSKVVVAKEISSISKEISESVETISLRLKEEQLSDEFLKELKGFIEKHSSPDGKEVVIEAELKDCFVKLQLHPDYRLPVDTDVLRGLQKLLKGGEIRVS